VSAGPEYVPAFDTTAYVADPAWFRGMADRGYRLYVLHTTSWGTCDPWPEAQRQIAAALDAGLAVAAYTRDPRCWRGGIEAAGPYAERLQFFALDVETDPGIPASPDMVAGIQALGVRPVLYSGADMWSEVQGFDDRRFSSVPLWDTGSETPVPYGGWNTQANPRTLVQTDLEVEVNGIKVDLDLVDAAFLN
jgi:hypothetical protein